MARVRSCSCQPSIGATFLCPSLILVKHVNGQPEGWGPTHPSSDTVTPCPAPNRSGVIPILSKADATIVMSICQALAAELTFVSFLQLFLNFPGGGVYRPLQSRFTGQIGLSSWKLSMKNIFCTWFPGVHSLSHLCSWIQVKNYSPYLLSSQSCLYFYL